MHRTTIAVGTEIAGIVPAEIDPDDWGVLESIKARCAGVLHQAKLHPVNTYKDQPHDPNWKSDIDGLVHRMMPRESTSFTSSGIAVVRLEVVKIDTLRVEVDHRGEVCAWIYQIKEL